MTEIERKDRHYMAFIRSMYVGPDIRRTAYWMNKRYDKPEIYGSTLWLVTSRENRAEPIDSPRRLVYSLVARLNNCKVTHDDRQPDWPLKFQGDSSSQQFASNFANFVLLGLQFKPSSPIGKMRGFGSILQNTRELSDRDIELLEEYVADVMVRPTVFLSYSHEDKRADAVQAILENSGIAVFRDFSSLKAGSDWKTEIGKAIEQSVVFVYLHSTPAEQSDYVKDEIKAALRIQDGKITIIPVPQHADDLPEQAPFDSLRDLQSIEWGELGKQAALVRLVSEVHRCIIHR